MEKNDFKRPFKVVQSKETFCYTFFRKKYGRMFFIGCQRGENMLSMLLNEKTEQKRTPFKEGDLYKVVSAFGETFELYYGYYEECERENMTVEPMPIYPDFTREPKYTKEDFAFVTKMQDACRHYIGRPGKNQECAECQYYAHGDELLGICTCKENKRE